MTVVADAPAALPPLTEREFLELVTPLAAYLYRTGFLLMFFQHDRYVRRLVERHRGGDILSDPIDITASLRRQGASRAVSADPEASRLSRLLPGFTLSLGALGEMLRNVRDAAQEAVVRSSWWTLRTATVVFATIVITFFTSDTWKILGRGPAWRVWSLDGAFVAAGIALVAKGRTWWRDVDRAVGTKGPTRDGRDFPLQILEPLWQYGIDGSAEGCASLARRRMPAAERGALWLVYLLNISLYILFAALWVAAALVVAGVLRIDATTTKELAGAAKVLSFSRYLPAGMVVTEQLVLVAVGLGTLAGLSMAVSLQDEGARSKFVDQALGGLQISFAVYAVYTEAWARVDELLSHPKGPEADPDREADDVAPSAEPDPLTAAPVG